MVLELFVVAGRLDGSIASGSGQRDLHWLLEQLEPLHLLNGLDRGLGAVEDDKCLSFGFQVRLCDDVNDVAILGEDGLERLSQRLGFDALL